MSIPIFRSGTQRPALEGNLAASLPQTTRAAFRGGPRISGGGFLSLNRRLAGFIEVLEAWTILRRVQVGVAPAPPKSCEAFVPAHLKSADAPGPQPNHHGQNQGSLDATPTARTRTLWFESVRRSGRLHFRCM